MRKITIAAAVLALALYSGAAWAQALVANTPHDFTGTGVIGVPAQGGIVAGGVGTGVNLGINWYCLPCHAPHNGSRTSTSQAGPLWNHTLSTVTFVQGTKTLTLGTSLPANSALCLGCHDGVTAVSSFNVADASQTLIASQVGQPIGAGLAGTPWITSVFGGTQYIGALMAGGVAGDLSNTHPISTVPTSSSFATVNSKGQMGAALLPLETLTNTNVSHGTAGTYMGCTTCHNPHDNTNGKFLRISNANSALCLNCHLVLN